MVTKQQTFKSVGSANISPYLGVGIISVTMVTVWQNNKHHGNLILLLMDTGGMCTLLKMLSHETWWELHWPIPSETCCLECQPLVLACWPRTTFLHLTSTRSRSKTRDQQLCGIIFAASHVNNNAQNASMWIARILGSTTNLKAH